MYSSKITSPISSEKNIQSFFFMVRFSTSGIDSSKDLQNLDT